VEKTEPILLTILRHGDVTGRAHVFRGTLDEPLSTHGATQMLQALMHCQSEKFDAIATSPLRRCHDFAESFARQQGVRMQVLPAFAELAFGDWEGCTPDEAAALSPEAYQKFRDGHGERPPPNGESLAQLRARVAQGWHDWMGEDCGANRLLVTHAGVMRALLMELFAFTPAQGFQIALPAAASMRISWLDGHPPFLLSLNH